MFLYHGTTHDVARIALDTGLIPRGGRASTWDAASSPDAIYLTDAYAPYFCFNACGHYDTRHAAVIVIDVDKLNPALLLADEDAVEQATRPNDPPGDILERTYLYRDNLDFVAEKGLDWKWSLKVLGTCSYHGPIPPEAIARVVHWDMSVVKSLSFIFDPTITLLNYKFMGAFYRHIMSRFVQAETIPELSDFDKFGRDQLLSSFDQQMAGVSVIENKRYLK